MPYRPYVPRWFKREFRAATTRAAPPAPERKSILRTVWEVFICVVMLVAGLLCIAFVIIGGGGGRRR